MTEPPAVPPLRLRRDAVAAGWSDDELARAVRAGELARLRRGAYVDTVLPAAPAARHALLVQATVAQLRRPAVVSHQSAAVLLGLPLWDVPLDRVHVTRPPGSWHDRSRVLCCHVARMRDDELVDVDGVLVTGPVRTMLDLARSLPHEAAVVALDAALHRGRLALDELRTRLFDIAGSPGARSAARAVAAADPRSESVGESRSRVILQRWQLAPSALQFEIRSGSGALVARTDFAWEDAGLAGEFDGRVKYGRLLRPGQEPGDAVFAEKLREDAIRDEQWGVVRWIWAELAVPHRLAAKVRRAQERTRGRRG
ncbi:type IV toxin-antitoxin system AbiEi family antitoxin domain-containing protein [Blastococcus sp. VKM Ac-2987]|uniref:type IV toxin-antitoxin system AbiEi family antitoxin domain-containing protein n=1 Tax=Blastococcus sp. VKM Ac-2987 TaxID=3004141 RepID=UPI0022AB6102|nr:type IV toxin-antitoxin system AbiEi family antitoxin domain-containing protein [Blastococcus sp. VKM Ac-2987]MCZ2858079.1 type IV toxin-antitoxin system AbiEi family antitoxin domain-containing protein [Blastococcus sp. VKM Ac-2987]